jgi:hypothetical protein
MNRRGILKLLGAATVGTLAHEQLLWLARQPVSVSSRVLEPNTVSLSIRGILPADTVRIYSGGILVHQSTYEGSVVSGTAVCERDVMVNVRGKSIKPFVVNA